MMNEVYFYFFLLLFFFITKFILKNFKIKNSINKYINIMNKITLVIIIVYCVKNLLILKNKYFINSNKNLLINSKNKFILINVLDKEYFDDIYIEKSINIPFSDVTSYLKSISDNKKAKLIFYCANYLCESSDEAALIAKKMGFEDVYVYKAGVAEWYQKSQEDSSYKYFGPAKSEYLKIKMVNPNFKIKIDEIEEDNKEKFKIIETEDLKDLISEKL